ncbi:glypican-1 [Osmerus eperlanus]|uniref:glypican-1 n=1 Tax=Osmerus eperlanus TaxID=29151 RepID=UPI002E101D61
MPSREHLRVCPQGYTCCTSAMEETLSNLSRREFEGLVREAGRSLQATLNAQYRSFDTYFTDLLNHSERSLQESLLVSLGLLYSQNAHIFQDLYADLRRYYRGSAVNLDETLNEFWARLLERLFKSSAASDYALSEDYLDCVSKHTETLRPFGDVPRDLKAKVTVTLVTSRSFVQGLTVAGEVVRKVSQVPLSPECTRAMMKLMYCPHCRGLASVKPCANYCSNVMKGCLANQADLDSEWQNLVDTMLQVASSFSAEPSIDVVISSIPLRLSEAIAYLQGNLQTFTAKVFQTCGSPGVAGTRSSAPEEQKKTGKPLTAQENRPSPTTGVRLEMQISDVSSKLREMQQYWVQLPQALCVSKVAAGNANEDKCWNGMTKARYLPEVLGDGLANQINNPEVEIDITKPDMTIRQQIMQLKIMTNRLRNALNGNDVDFQDTSEDVSGSGSGMCAGDLCVRAGPRAVGPKSVQPKQYAYPPEKKVRSVAAQTRPCTLLLVLSLATLLLRR